jgi:hypothetical protein
MRGHQRLFSGNYCDLTRVPDRIRTCDPQFRKLVLYPAELPGHAARVYFFETIVTQEGN